MIDVNWNPPPSQLRVFGLLLLAFFGVVGYLAYEPGAAAASWILWSLGALAGGAGLLRPRSIILLYISWMGLALPVGLVVSTLLLGGVYLLIITPIGLLQRLLGGDPMRRRLEREAATYWIPVKPRGGPTRYFRQY